MDTENLDYLINLAYEYFYLKNTEKCYDIIDIDLNDIDDVSNVKIVPHINKINSYINQIFNTNVTYLKKINDEYIFIRIGPVNTTISIKLYQSDETKNDLTSEDNNEKVMRFLLSDFVTKKFTKHILLPILNVDLPVKNLLPFFNKHPNTDELQKQVSKTLSISISERFFKMMSLEEYIDKNSNLINENFIFCVLWQIVHTLAIIRQKYPNFNNNLLDIESVNVYVTDNNEHNSKYEYNGKTFIVPNNGIVIKIGNFHLSEINSKNSDDIKTFIESLINNNSINDYLKINPEIKKIIIEYINMKPEQLMETKNFTNYFNSNNSENKNKSKSTNNLASRTLNNVVYGSRMLFMSQNQDQNGGKSKPSDSDDISDDSDDSVSNSNMHKSKRHSKSKKHSKSKRHSKSKKHSKSKRYNSSEQSGNGKNNENNKPKISKMAQALGVNDSEFANYQNMNEYGNNRQNDYAQQILNSNMSGSSMSGLNMMGSNMGGLSMMGTNMMGPNMMGSNNDSMSNIMTAMQGITGQNQQGMGFNMGPNMMGPNMMPPNMMGSSMMPPNMMGSSMMPPSMMPPSMMPPSMMPQNMMAPNMMPQNMMAPNMMPQNMMSPSMMNSMGANVAYGQQSEDFEMSDKKMSQMSNVPVDIGQLNQQQLNQLNQQMTQLSQQLQTQQFQGQQPQQPQQFQGQQSQQFQGQQFQGQQQLQQQGGLSDSESSNYELDFNNNFGQVQSEQFQQTQQVQSEQFQQTQQIDSEMSETNGLGLTESFNNMEFKQTSQTTQSEINQNGGRRKSKSSKSSKTSKTNKRSNKQDNFFF
jgi:hypothetical protein